MINKRVLIVALVALLGLGSAISPVAAAQSQRVDTQLHPAATDLNVQISEVKLFSAAPGPGGPLGPPPGAPHVRMRWTVSHPPFIRVLGFSIRVIIEFANGETKTLTQTADASVREVNLTFAETSSVALHFKAFIETRFNALAPTAVVTSSDRFILTKSNNFDSHGSSGPGTSPAGPLVRLTEVKNGPQGFTASWLVTARADLEYTAFELEGEIAFTSPAGTTTRQATARAGGSGRQATLILRGGGQIPVGDGLSITVNLTIKAFGNSSSTKVTEKAGDF